MTRWPARSYAVPTSRSGSVALGRFAQPLEVVGAADGIEVAPRDQALGEARLCLVEPQGRPGAGSPEAGRDAGLFHRAHGGLGEGAPALGLGAAQAELGIAAVEADQYVAQRRAGAFPCGQLDDGPAGLALELEQIGRANLAVDGNAVDEVAASNRGDRHQDRLSFRGGRGALRECRRI